MDTRDQTLTKLTWLHGNLIQLITVQQAYDEITHARWWASWNWWWRMVDDDDGDGFPSPEPRTDSRSALPREIRAWRRLRINTMNPSPWFFSPQKWIYGVKVDVGGASGGPRGRGRAQGVGAPPPSWTGCGPPDVDSSSSIFNIFQKWSPLIFRSFRDIYFCTKITPWKFCWKQRQSGLVPFKSYNLESKTRAKVFGKVDTSETYQLPQA